MQEQRIYHLLGAEDDKIILYVINQELNLLKWGFDDIKQDSAWFRHHVWEINILIHELCHNLINSSRFTLTIRIYFSVVEQMLYYLENSVYFDDEAESIIEKILDSVKKWHERKVSEADLAELKLFFNEDSFKKKLETHGYSRLLNEALGQCIC